jgi:hypothetical protein
VGGVWTLAQAPSPRERPLAAIPVIFAVQQFAEGLVWVGVANDQAVLTAVFSYVFSFFALFLWPIYVPLAMRILEPGPRRKRILDALLVVGACAAVVICGSLVRHPLETHLLRGHICYHAQPTYEAMGLYFLAVGAPCFSSHRWLQVFGVLLVLSLAVSLGLYAAEFVSVWCFFAAALSAVLWLHVARRSPPGALSRSA